MAVTPGAGNHVQRSNRWLAILALILMSLGQFAYACETMGAPPQALCCCGGDESHCADADTAADTIEDNCGAPADSSGACCVLEYSTPASEAITASTDAQQFTAWQPFGLSSWPALATLYSPTFARGSTTGGIWLLAQANSGRTVYLSTLRLRI